MLQPYAHPTPGSSMRPGFNMSNWSSGANGGFLMMEVMGPEAWFYLRVLMRFPM